MIYFENPGKGSDGFTSHLMSYTLAISLSKFLDRPFFFDYEIPSSTPPEFASRDEFKDRFGVLLDSPRSLVSQLVDMPANRVFEIDRNKENKVEYQLISSYFATTEELKDLFAKTAIWDFFSFGRFALTREELQTYDLIDWTHSSLSHPSCFYFLRRKEKEELLRSVEVRFLPEIEQLAAEIVAGLGQYYSVHIRMGDFLQRYSDEYALNLARYRAYVSATFPDHSIPVVISTDALHETNLFDEIFNGRPVIYIDELILGNYRERYLGLPFTDFNVLVALDELVCAAGEIFIGTFRSTFTGMIHRLRQERHGYKDFNFFPDDRVAQLLDENMRITKDRSGFFDWNRYAALTPDHNSLSWRREWDFDKTSVDF